MDCVGSDWAVVGHCPHCGCPIWAARARTAGKPPEVRRSCSCAEVVNRGGATPVKDWRDAVAGQQIIQTTIGTGESKVVYPPQQCRGHVEELPGGGTTMFGPGGGGS